MKENFDIWVKALENERDKLIEENPELKAYQEEIEKALEGIEDPLERAAKLNEMLMQKMRDELLPAMAELRKLQNKTKKAA